MIDVKLIRIITGEEIIAEVLEETASYIKVQNGLVVLPSAQSVGFAPWATVISKESQRLPFRKHTLYMWQKFKKMSLKSTTKCLVVNSLHQHLKN